MDHLINEIIGPSLLFAAENTFENLKNSILVTLTEKNISQICSKFETLEHSLKITGEFKKMTAKKKNDVLDSSFDPSKLDDLIYCVKDENTNVLFQNDACIQKCSDLKGQPCAKGCMQYYSKLTPTNKDRKGFHFFERRNIDGQNYDIAILRKPNFIISYLHKSLDVGESSKKLLETPGLTKREKEILSMRLELGLTLKEICEKLFISRATLKTHMNNLNKKLVAAKSLK